MSPVAASAPIAARLVDTLYTEAMLLADETRGYFDQAGVAERDALPPRQRVEFACEALKGTTRLMQLIAWLLVRKAVAAGELSDVPADTPQRRLGDAPPLDAAMIADLPETARRLLVAGAELYERVRRIDEGIVDPPAVPSPARSLLERLERSF